VSTELDADERVLFAALLAPGILAAAEEDVVAPDVVAWSPAALPRSLAAALVRQGVRVEKLGL
ncbi:MAG: hypothetical protein QOG64_2976, partial [Acidimicrobiaceae bacterium]|nr:hypothetical protein [Acidimicrobiaceae bacterium]